jgi:DNA (cytosine-5)-methyltransferase 1
MRKRLFIIGIKNNHKNISQINKIFDLKKYEKKFTLSEYLNKNFEKKIAYTLRCGGRRSPIDDKHNWDGYYVDKKEYRLTIDDGLKLQGFTDPNFKLTGSDTDIWKLLGNTIPTNFTDIIGRQINELFFN